MKTLPIKSITVMSLCLIYFAFLLPGSLFAYSETNPMVLKCGIDNPPGDMKARTIKRLGDFVQEKTNGRVVFKYFYGTSLIKKPQFVDAVARGIADISTGPVSFVTGKIPELSIFEIYGAYRLDKFLEMQEAVMPTMIELFEKKGVHPLFIQYSGSCIFPHKRKFLKRPDDWKGEKMRLAGRWQSTLGKKWGASPIFLPPAELYLALQRGVIDGYMLIWDIVYGLKLYEVAPYIVDTGFSNNAEVVTMNLKKWRSLTKEDRDIFLQGIKDIKPWTYRETLKYYDFLRKDIISKGGKIHKLTPEAKSLYLKDAFALYPEVRKVAGTIGNKFIDILEPHRDR
ncbi:MAG: TRAP transporter substrate-binding protein [Deltaproteobacteria bacterium]|nr:TRAP transporter substrate-binding protein [Deltaproteobacteria bacterium]